MENPKVLILDDDITFLTATKEYLVKKGYDVVAVNSAQDAKGFIEAENIQNILIDCLLPAESGIDFVKSLRQTPVGKQLNKVILTSAYFTDPSFIKEAFSETGATDFLVKPFEMEELIAALPPAVGNIDKVDGIRLSRRRLYEVFSSEKRDPRWLTKLLEKIESLHGFDLPLIYNLILETQVSGFLNLSSEDGRIFGVTFCNGKIVGVDFDDKETFLGKILIEHGFISPGDLESVLMRKGTRKLGEALINEYYISPHALQIAMIEQMGLRLSRTIVDQEVKLNFVRSQIEEQSPYITVDQVGVYLHDWVISKLNLYWLRAQLAEWKYSKIKKHTNFSERLKNIKELVLFKTYSVMFQEIMSEKSLGQLIEKYANEEEVFLKIIYFLLMKGAIYFSDEGGLGSQDLATYLDKIESGINSNSEDKWLEIISQALGVSFQSKSLLHDHFLNSLRPFEKNKDTQIKERANKLMLKTEAFFNANSNYDAKRQNESTPKAGPQSKASLPGEVNPLDAVKIHISKNEFDMAYKLLNAISQKGAPIAKYNLYYTWVLLGIQMQKNPNQKVITESNEIKNSFMKITPEEKYDPIYHFLLGLNYKMKGQLEMALRSFEKALALDAQFIFARREMMLLRGDQNKVTPSGDKDLKSLVGNIFSKKR